MTFHRHIFAVGILATALVGFGCQRPQDEDVQAARETNPTAPDDTNAPLSEADKAFLNQAQTDSIKERSIARVALDKSRNEDVRDYAEMIVDDHTEALDQAVKLMNEKGIPQPNNLPEAKHEAEAKLSSLSGPAFDREFASMMVQDHEKAVEAFRNEQNTAQNADVKEYASDLLPTLEKHLQNARDLQGKLHQGNTNTNE
jgi:putative membrane protein